MKTSFMILSDIPSEIPMEASAFLETNTLTNLLAVVSILLSFVAIIVSLYYGHKAYQQAVNLNNVNIEIDYYKKIFDKYIIDEIPKLRRELIISSDNKIPYSSCMSFQQTMVNLLNDIYFFSFRDREFYDNLKSIIYKIDDTIVSNMNVVFDEDEEIRFFSKVDNYLNSLYSQIFRSALG